jgi:hypothetical protein
MWPLTIITALMAIGFFGQFIAKPDYCRKRFFDLMHEVKTCNDIEKLEMYQDLILDMFRTYRRDSRISNYTGQLFAALENRKVRLLSKQLNYA